MNPDNLSSSGSSIDIYYKIKLTILQKQDGQNTKYLIQFVGAPAQNAGLRRVKKAKIAV